MGLIAAAVEPDWSPSVTLTASGSAATPLSISTPEPSPRQWHSPAFSGEFRFVAAACCWPATTSSKTYLREAAESCLDWERVVRIAARHRVAGLVFRAVRALQISGATLPPAPVARLSQMAGDQARQALSFTFDSGKLDRSFRSGGIEPIFLKGAALAVLGYGEAGLRHAKDIDVLVPQALLPAAAEVLRSAGYRRRLPGEEVSAEKFALWQRFAHSTEWSHPQTAGEVELHGVLTDMPSLLQSRRALGDLQRVRVSRQIELTTLGTDSLFAYLCVHGAGHGWSRLKWLADVHALTQSGPGTTEEKITRLYRWADSLGSGRCAAQALLLCEELFGLRLPPALRAELRAQPVVRLLVRIARHILGRGDGEHEIYAMPFGTATVYLSRFLLGRGIRFLGREARLRAFPPDTLLETRLPNSALALFPLLRFWRWVWTAGHKR